MLLTTKGRYAVMAMVELALVKDASPMNLATIAERQEIDKGYLEQIFMRLKKEGLVMSTRGPGGGYMLNKSSKDISIADIMLAAEEDFKVTRCQNHTSGGCLNNKTRCATHHLWENLENNIFNHLKAISLQDVCSKKFSFAKMEAA